MASGVPFCSAATTTRFKCIVDYFFFLRGLETTKSLVIFVKTIFFNPNISSFCGSPPCCYDDEIKDIDSYYYRKVQFKFIIFVRDGFGALCSKRACVLYTNNTRVRRWTTRLYRKSMFGMHFNVSVGEEKGPPEENWGRRGFQLTKIAQAQPFTNHQIWKYPPPLRIREYQIDNIHSFVRGFLFIHELLLQYQWGFTCSRFKIIDSLCTTIDNLLFFKIWSQFSHSLEHFLSLLFFFFFLYLPLLS